MKITVYTIKDCAFSKQEKEYLNTNKLVFEEKDLETNKDFLTEMLAISNNFAGTPVTRVEKDDGTIAVLKGFTKAEFDTVFGFTAEVKPPVEAEVKPVVETPPTPPSGSVSSAPIPTETPVNTTPDPLKSVMDDLQAKAEPAAPVVEEPPVAPPIQPTTTDSTSSTTPPAGAPTIPDFPAK
ncbi:MAG: glutaredoxin family protein [Patescibacteria group bacterium]|jgi:glutaredoxin